MNLIAKTIVLVALCFVLFPQQQSNGVSPPTVVPGAQLTVVYSSNQYFEGPSWDPVGQKLYFTAFEKENEQILRLDSPNEVSLWLDHTKGMNGTYYSRNGRLLVAQAFGHTLSSFKIGVNGPEDTKVLASDLEDSIFRIRTSKAKLRARSTI